MEIGVLLPRYNLPLFFPHTDGEDFSPQVDISSLFFEASSVNGQLLCINFTIVDDLCFEKDHNFSISINTTEDNVDIGPLADTSVLIIDNEGVIYS